MDLSTVMSETNAAVLYEPAPSELVPILPGHLDSTMLSTFRSCPRKFYNEFVLGRRHGKSIDLHAGKCLASALEFIYRRIFADWEFELALAAGEIHFHREWGDFPVPEGHNKTRERVWTAVETYIRHWGGKSDPIKPYMIGGQPSYEWSFAVPLDRHTTGLPFPLNPQTNEPFIFSGRFDMLGELDGVPVIRDEKTTKSISKKWTEQWDMRGQFIGYKWATGIQGIPNAMVCVRGIGILKTDITLVQVIRSYSNAVVQRWLEQTLRDVVRITAAFTAGEAAWDYNFAEACTAYGKCMFSEACSSSEPSSWLTQFPVSRWNPLEVNPNELD